MRYSIALQAFATSAICGHDYKTPCGGIIIGGAKEHKVSAGSARSQALSRHRVTQQLSALSTVHVCCHLPAQVAQ